MDCFINAQITDWLLKAEGVDLKLNQRIMWHTTVKEYEKEIRSAANRGELEPRSPLTFLPVPQATGEQLLDSFVTVGNLQSYASRFQIGVVIEEQFTVKGITGNSTMNNSANEKYQQALDARRALGRYSIVEAAQ
jgi:hypothetical protein